MEQAPVPIGRLMRALATLTVAYYNVDPDARWVDGRVSYWRYVIVTLLIKWRDHGSRKVIPPWPVSLPPDPHGFVQETPYSLEPTEKLCRYIESGEFYGSEPKPWQ